MSRTFWDWWQNENVENFDGDEYGAAEAAWHARDAEVAALTEQLANWKDIAKQAHEVVEEMRVEAAASRAAMLREAAAHCLNISHLFDWRYPGKTVSDHILALIDPANQSALDRERAEAREQALIDVQQFYNQSDMPECQIFEDWLKRQFAALRQAAQGS